MALAGAFALQRKIAPSYPVIAAAFPSRLLTPLLRADPVGAQIGMPSWNDVKSLSPSILGDLTDIDYAPDFIEDPTFHGIAVDCPEVCRINKLKPVKCVAFEGSTCRRFYLCCVQNEVENCGFVAWLDKEWTETAKMH